MTFDETMRNNPEASIWQFWQGGMIRANPDKAIRRAS